MSKDREIQIFKLDRVFRQKANIPILYEDFQEKPLNCSTDDPIPTQLSYTVHRLRHLCDSGITIKDFIIEDVIINEYITKLKDENENLIEIAEFVGNSSFWRYLKFRFNYRRIK